MGKLVGASAELVSTASAEDEAVNLLSLIGNDVHLLPISNKRKGKRVSLLFPFTASRGGQMLLEAA